MGLCLCGTFEHLKMGVAVGMYTKYSFVGIESVYANTNGIG
jgi:hypothetical protein